VGLLPDMTKWNAIRLLNRLKLTEPERPWFIHSELLDLLPDPMTYVYQKPQGCQIYEVEDVEAQSEPEQSVVLRKAETFTKGELLWKGQTYQLVIDLSSIVFNFHPLMLEEQRLAMNITQWVETIQNRKRNNLGKFLDSKLEALKLSYIEAKKDWSELCETLNKEDHIVENYRKNNNRAKLELAVTESENSRMVLLKEIKAARLLRVKATYTRTLKPKPIGC
jgi:hypothetical protein